MDRCCLQSSGHDIGSVGFRAHGNEKAVTLKWGKLLDQLRNCQVLKKDTAVPTCLMQYTYKKDVLLTSLLTKSSNGKEKLHFLAKIKKKSKTSINGLLCVGLWEWVRLHIAKGFQLQGTRAVRNRTQSLTGWLVSATPSHFTSPPVCLQPPLFGSRIPAIVVRRVAEPLGTSVIWYYQTARPCAAPYSC